MSLRKLRDQPGGGAEVLTEHGRATLWVGEAPSIPVHPNLSWALAKGQLRGERAWLEHRPEGARLDELSGLTGAETAMLLLDVAEGLAELHREGLSHGAVDAHHIVVGPGGRATLIGPRGGDRTEAREDDAGALRRLMAELWPATAPPPPDPGLEPASVLAEALAGWLAFEFPDHSPFSLGSRSRAAMPPPEPSTPLPFREDERFDEVGLGLGEDLTSRGLLDRWATGRSLSGAITGAIEWTRPQGGDSEDLPDVQLLARLMAPPDHPPDPARFSQVQGQPCQPIKALMADEPLDPLPLPSGVPLSAPLPGAIPTPLARIGNELPTEPGTRPSIREEVSSRALTYAGVALVAALVTAGALLAWVLT
jgi:hypothetical protein